MSCLHLPLQFQPTILAHFMSNLARIKCSRKLKPQAVQRGASIACLRCRVAALKGNSRRPRTFLSNNRCTLFTCFLLSCAWSATSTLYSFDSSFGNHPCPFSLLVVLFTCFGCIECPIWPVYEILRVRVFPVIQ